MKGKDTMIFLSYVVILQSGVQSENCIKGEYLSRSHRNLSGFSGKVRNIYIAFCVDAKSQYDN